MLPSSAFYIKHWIRPDAVLCLAYMQTIAVVWDREMAFVRLEDSIPFRALLTGDYTLYEEYMRTTDQAMHTVERFQRLQREWDGLHMDPIQMTVEKGRLAVIDGAHRAAIMAARGETCAANAANGAHRMAIMLMSGDVAGGFPFSRLEIHLKPAALTEIGDALQRTRSGALSNGWSNHRGEGAPFGYHTYSLWNVKFAGQRDPVMRLNIMRTYYNFAGKRVIDLGCNTGGMLFHLLEAGPSHGVDLDARCIEAARVIQQEFTFYPHTFQVADLDTTDPAHYLSNADVIFLLSMGSWLRNWPVVYLEALRSAPVLFVEMNNDQEGVAQLDFFRRYAMVTCITEGSWDDATGNHGRKMYFVERLE